MAVLAYDDVMLREPNLLIPRCRPVGIVRIDQSHPLALGLVGCWLFSQQGHDLLGKFGASVLTGNAKIERGVLVLDGAGDYLTAASPIVAAPLSLGVVMESATAADEVAAMIGSNYNTAWDGWYFLSNTSTPSLNFTSVNANTFDGSVPGGLPRFPVAACGSATTTRLQAAVNGILGTEDTSFTNPGTVTAPAVIRIGATARSNAGADIIAEIPLVCAWNRALSDADLMSWSADPYQIFVPA